MVDLQKNIQWWWSRDGKTIEKPSMAMVPWKRNITIPSLWKNYHRWSLLPLLRLLSPAISQFALTAASSALLLALSSLVLLLKRSMAATLYISLHTNLQGGVLTPRFAPSTQPKIEEKIPHESSLSYHFSPSASMKWKQIFFGHFYYTTHSGMVPNLSLKIFLKKRTKFAFCLSACGSSSSQVPQLTTRSSGWGTWLSIESKVAD